MIRINPNIQNPCRKEGHNHDWKICPDNANDCNYQNNWTSQTNNNSNYNNGNSNSSRNIDRNSSRNNNNSKWSSEWSNNNQNGNSNHNSHGSNAHGEMHSMEPCPCNKHHVTFECNLITYQWMNPLKAALLQWVSLWQSMDH